MILDEGAAARNPGEPGTGRTRILLYSHDSWGLGHLRRNLTIAASLVETLPGASALVVTGSPCATHFPHPPGVSLVKLPSVDKDGRGDYRPRSLPGSLEFVLRMRARLLLETLRSFEPHLLIVDHQVIGLHGEALETLREARARGVRTLLGIRDIIDSPETVARQWSSPEIRWALAEAYDRVCVYGSEEVFDPRIEYPIPPELAERVEFTGYVVRPRGRARRRPRGDAPSVLVTAGGGQDGSRRVEAYLDALALGPVAWRSVVLTGPLMPAADVERLRRAARRLGSVKIRQFQHDLPRLLEESTAVVAMAGYNTTAEILQSRRPAVLLPRTFPRREQLIRAERLSRLGLVRHQSTFDPPELRRLVEGAVAGPGRLPPPPGLDGCRRLCDIVADLLRAAGGPRFAAGSGGATP